MFSVELCRESFVAEGASPAEIESEVALIKTQLAFVKQMKGDLDGALSDYRNVLKLKCVSWPHWSFHACGILIKPS